MLTRRIVRWCRHFSLPMPEETGENLLLDHALCRSRRKDAVLDFLLQAQPEPEECLSLPPPQGGGGGFSGAAYAGLASVTTDFIAMYAFANIKRSSIDRGEDSTTRTTTTTTIDEDNSSYPSWTPARRTKHWIKNDAVVSATTRPCGRATLTVRRASGKYFKRRERCIAYMEAL